MDTLALSEDDRFAIMEKYFSEKGPVFHQFESYEYMLDVILQKPHLGKSILKNQPSCLKKHVVETLLTILLFL